jgi:hypothetical protein
MKTIITIITLLAIGLTGCATGNDAYYKAIEARENRLAQQEMLADTAIADMAAKGDAQARGMGIMYFALKAAGSKAGQQMIAAPKSVAEQILPWAALLVPSLTQVYGIKAQTDVAIINSNNSVKNQESSNDMIVDLVKGRKEPIVGQQGDVLLYGN